MQPRRHLFAQGGGNPKNGVTLSGHEPIRIVPGQGCIEVPTRQERQRMARYAHKQATLNHAALKSRSSRDGVGGGHTAPGSFLGHFGE